MKHKLYTRLLSLALAVGLVIGMLPCAAAVDTVGDAGQPVTLGNGDQVSFTLPVKLYGDDGTDLSSAKTVNILIVDGQTVQLPGEYTQGIETISSGDKTYNYDYVAAGFNGERIDQLQAGLISTNTDDGVIIESGGGFGDSWRILKYTTTYTYAVWYGNKPNSATSASVIATRSYTEEYKQRQERFIGWYDDGDPYDYKTNPLQKQVDKKTIHFMYDKEGTLVPDKELTREKTVIDNKDGTYDLTLTVSGAAGSITNPQKLDVVFIVDKSGSMAWDMNHDDGSWRDPDLDADDTPRLTAVKNAIRQIASELDSSETIDARYSLVSFSGNNEYGDRPYNDAKTDQDWTTNKDVFIGMVNSISANGGTNYEAGLYSANQLLKDVRPGAMTAVVFLSDGEPTFYYNESGYTQGSGSSYSSTGMEHAKTEAGKMDIDFFYAIGVGDGYDEQDYEYSETTMPEYMKDLVSGAKKAEKAQFFDGNNSSALDNIFNEIAGDITSILCSNVTVTDTLSENVEIVTGGSGSGTPTSDDFTITVVGEDGQTVATDKGSVQVDGATIIASYNQETRQIVLDFPDDYQLKKGYTYKVTTKIQATEAAYEAYRNNENVYPDTGDQGTGTHAGKAGLYTNNKAAVDYTYNGKNYSAEYPMPVIQLDPGTLTITKQITGDLTKEQVAALEDSIKFEVKLDGVETSYPLSNFTSQGDNSYTMSIAGLSPNTQYTVTETGAELPGYILTQTPTGGTQTGTVTKGGTATVAFTNNYKVATRDISVTKVWEGSETNPESVTVWLYADKEKTNKSVTLNAENNWTDSFTGLDIYSTAGEVIDYTVQEETVDGYTGVVTGNMTDGFTITNTRDTGSLTITKTVDGLDGTALNELEDELKFTVTGPDDYSKEIAFNATGWEQDGDTYTYTLENVPTGEYTVTETGYDTLEKYSWVASSSTIIPQTANVTTSGGKVEFTNYYIGKDGTLNINKVVTGFANDGKPVFDFKLTAEDGTVYYYHVDMTGTGANQEKPVASVTLPVDDYTITELNNQNYTLKSVNVDGKTIGNGGTITITPQGTTTVTFTNDPNNTDIPTDGGATENRVDKIEGGMILWKKEVYGTDHPEAQPSPNPNDNKD